MLVLIPSLELGQDYHHTQHYKAMIQIGDVPVISHIISLSENTVIIMLGYKGEHIKQYLNLVYKNRKFIFKELKIIMAKGQDSL